MKLIGLRLVALPVSLIVLITLSFGLIELLPGNPAVTIAGDFATEERIDQIEAELGLNEPLHARYVDYLAHVARGDLGTSYFSDQPVTNELMTRLPATLELIIPALALSVVFGLLVGTAGAYFRGRAPDRLSRGVLTVCQSVPEFVVALLLIYVLFYLWGVAPAPVGQVEIGGANGTESATGFLLVDALVAGDPQAFFEAVRHLMLPVLALGIVNMAYFARTARSTMASSLASSQVEFARSCGLSEWRVLHYAWLQARTPILTYGAILFGALLGGAAIVETIFAWQGAGEYALNAILELDIPVIQGFIIVSGVLTILIYLLLDVLVILLDPRIRYE